MRVSISSSDGTPLKSERHVFREIGDNFLVTDEVTRYDNAYLKGVIREISFGGVFMTHSLMEMGSPIKAHFINDNEYMEMHFMLKGYCYIKDKNSNRAIKITPDSHDIFYLNGVEGYTETVGMPVESFQIIFLPESYQKYFPFDNPVLEKLSRSIAKASSYDVVANHNTALNYEIHQVIHDILQCPHQGGLKKICLESKVMELLILQIESLSTGNTPPASAAHKSDTERLYAVKEYIENNLTETCKLIDIAHQFGTNEFSLNSGFKKLFGTTIYQYWLDCRLKKAAHLIEYARMNINEAAYEIGYKNPQHFTAAFKRKFGYLPSRMKKQ